MIFSTSKFEYTIRLNRSCFHTVINIQSSEGIPEGKSTKLSTQNVTLEIHITEESYGFINIHKICDLTGNSSISKIYLTITKKKIENMLIKNCIPLQEKRLV